MTDDQLRFTIRESIADAIGPLREAMVELQHDLATHINDPYAHPAADGENRRKVAKLWDERNEMKGMMRVLIGGVLGSPIVAALLVYALNHLTKS